MSSITLCWPEAHSAKWINSWPWHSLYSLGCLRIELLWTLSWHKSTTYCWMVSRNATLMHSLLKTRVLASFTLQWRSDLEAGNGFWSFYTNPSGNRWGGSEVEREGANPQDTLKERKWDQWLTGCQGAKAAAPRPSCWENWQWDMSGNKSQRHFGRHLEDN